MPQSKEPTREKQEPAPTKSAAKAAPSELVTAQKPQDAPKKSADKPADGGLVSSEKPEGTPQRAEDSDGPKESVTNAPQAAPVTPEKPQDAPKKSAVQAPLADPVTPKKVQDATKKSNATVGKHDELTPEKIADASQKPFKRPEGFGGLCKKSEVCGCCDLPRLPGQRSGVCEHCMRKCRQDFKHQRISQVIADPDLKAVFRAAALEIREQERSGSAKLPESKRLKRMEALADRLDGLVERFEQALAKLES